MDSRGELNYVFRRGSLYSRNDIWGKYHPNEDKRPKGGTWDTGYVREGNDLLAFLNIYTSGRTGHDFKNEYDEPSKKIVWFGKPNAHSKQPLFQSLIDGKLTPLFFARWDNRARFCYLGVGEIVDFEDGIEWKRGEKTIRLSINIKRVQRKPKTGTGLQRKIAKFAALKNRKIGTLDQSDLDGEGVSSKSDQKRKTGTGLQRKIKKAAPKEEKIVVKKRAPRRPWTNEEVVVLVAIYSSQSFSVGDDEKAECKNIAKAFGRSPGTIDRQWRNIKNCLEGKPVKKVGVLVKETAENMRRDPKKIRKMAKYYCDHNSWYLDDLIE